MRTSVTLGYFLGGTPVKPSQEICIIVSHPGIIDAIGSISLTDLISLATSTYEVVEGNFEAAAAAIVPVLKDLYSGKNWLESTHDHLTYLQHGRFVVNGQIVHPDEIRVVFRATSDDDLTKSIGQVAQSADIHGTQIPDGGETKQDHQYTHKFSIPLRTITPGDYVFTFGSGDSGDFFRVGASTILTVTILPRPA